MSAPSATSTVDESLARYAALTREAMERFLPVDGLGDGGLGRLVRDYPDRPGKGLRPALVMATCQAYGGSLREALGPAVAIEMLHNAFLIHDDLEDESVLRRGRPTLHSAHGVPLAVNAGDALAVLSLAALHDRAELGSRLGERVMAEVLEMARLTTAGQNLELHWRRENVVDLEPRDYLHLVLHKSCTYTTIYPLRIGALVGSHGAFEPATLEAITAFGFYLGAAFQIRDDLLNLTGSVDRYGKELLGDLREGKRTLALIHLLRAASPTDRAWLTEVLARPIVERGDTEARQLLALMHRYRSLDMAATWADALAQAAYDAFAPAFADLEPSPHTDFLRELVPYMVERSS
jgi:geranylgeranyl diphosphate synthase type II